MSGRTRTKDEHSHIPRNDSEQPREKWNFKSLQACELKTAQDAHAKGRSGKPAGRGSFIRGSIGPV